MSITDREGLPPAVILAGGLGTRLRSVYAAGPKSMAPVKGRPFLDYLLAQLKKEGVKEVILCVGYKKCHIHRFVGSGDKWGLRAKYSVEHKLLGTGGALKKAEQLISEDRILVVNGDTFLDVNLRELVEFHESRKAAATLAAVKVADSARYGSLRLDSKSRITAFLEKSGREGSQGPRTEKKLVNGGMYVLEKSLLRAIGMCGPMSLERDIFPSLLPAKSVYGFASDAYFLDIGVPLDLWRAQSELPQRIVISHPR